MSKKLIVAINEVDFGSTGGIATNILSSLDKSEYDTLLVCHESLNRFDNEYIINKNKFRYLLTKIRSRIDASDGFHARKETRKLVKYLSKRKVDLLLLNNLHGSYINLEILFNYIKQNKIKCLYTLHDCWSFTGKCAYFSFSKCDKWKNGCYDCPNLKEHPRAYFLDKSKKLYSLKKKLFEGMDEFITLVCPSKWIYNLLSDSYLKNFNKVLINNGIDFAKFNKNFKPTFKERHNLINKKIILCIANVFTIRKGLFEVIKLSKLLKENEVIVLVGQLINKITLPFNIIHIEKTSNIDELTDIYLSSDVFFNPTCEDNYPTVNMEANYLSLPIVCYNTGGAVELVDQNYIVKDNKVEDSYKLISKLLENPSLYRFMDYNLILDKIMVEKYIKLIKEAIRKCQFI